MQLRTGRLVSVILFLASVLGLCSSSFVRGQQSLCADGGVNAERDGKAASMRLALVENEAAPVISVDSTGADGRHFEGGIVVKVGGLYRLFTTEQKDNVNTRLAEWTSRDRIHWERKGTLFTSTGDQTGTDSRASLWSPLVVFDEELDRWNMLYVGYFSKPNTGGRWYENYDGSVIRAVSEKLGVEGVDGPYKDIGNLMRPSKDSMAWEGLQGTDSFYPWKIGSRWIAFYGSANTETTPVTAWRVGLAAAPSLAGPWIRCPTLSPSPIERHFVENPIVYSVEGVYVAIYDVDIDDPHAVGYAFSSDGVRWSQGRRLTLQPQERFQLRTPISLIREEDGTYSLFYTAYDKKYRRTGASETGEAANIYLAKVRVEH